MSDASANMTHHTAVSAVTYRLAQVSHQKKLDNFDGLNYKHKSITDIRINKIIESILSNGIKDIEFTFLLDGPVATIRVAPQNHHVAWI